MGFSAQDETVIPKTFLEGYILKKMLPSLPGYGLLELKSEGAKISVFSKNQAYVHDPGGVKRLVQLEEYSTTFQSRSSDKVACFAQSMIGDWKECEIKNL